jgi:short chain dehydrogenase
MSTSIPFGPRSTADQVLAGVDLTRKQMVVTGCDSEVALETMKALIANGAHVVGVARTSDDARVWCSAAGPSSTPLGCDLADLASVDAAVESIRRLNHPVDAVIANSDTRSLASPQMTHRREGSALITEPAAHFTLVSRLAELIRSRTGRIVIGSSDASMTEELSRRLAARSVAVNSFHFRPSGSDNSQRLLHSVFRYFTRSPAQRAATPALLAASPLVEGITGQHWSNCQVTPSNSSRPGRGYGESGRLAPSSQ